MYVLENSFHPSIGTHKYQFQESSEGEEDENDDEDEDEEEEEEEDEDEEEEEEEEEEFGDERISIDVDVSAAQVPLSHPAVTKPTTGQASVSHNNVKKSSAQHIITREGLLRVWFHLG